MCTWNKGKVAYLLVVNDRIVTGLRKKTVERFLE